MNIRFRAVIPAGIWRRVVWGAGVFLLTVNAGLANPQGGEIVGGRGAIESRDANTMLISQFSQNLAIDWTSFNVAANERVIFAQPSTTASALNRIFDQNPSQIFGAIDANGRVFLINPNGIVFGRGSRINLQSLIASSLDISVEDFMTGNYTLQALADREGGLVLNQGHIQAADGGSITLVGGAVANEGVLVANYGSVNLAAGRKATLDFTGEGLMLFALDEGVMTNDNGVAAAVSNSGHITADGGQVLLTASAAGDVFSSVVNNSGVVRANRIDNTGGVIRLVGDGGAVINSGKLLARGETSDDTGGRISMLGDSVNLQSGAVLDASGPAGGGDVRVGGDFHGVGEQTAQFAEVEAGATIAADAEVEGDGGTVVVWSDDTTIFRGDISAEGGINGGDGGLVEVSGKQNLLYRGRTSTRSPHGEFGTLILDPGEIIICAAGDSDCAAPDSLNTWLDFDLALALDLSSVLLDTQLATNGGSHNIRFNPLVHIDWTSATNLLVLAGADVTLDGTIDASLGSVGISFGRHQAGTFTVESTASLSAVAINAASGNFGNVFDIGAALPGDLTGGSMADTFILSGGALNGSIDGRGGADTFILSGGTVNGTINGGIGSDELIADNVTNFWNITGANAGSVTGVAGGFIQIENLTGGSAEDFFFLVGALAGTADGGAGDDIFLMQGGSANVLDGGAGIGDMLIGDGFANTWLVTADNAGTLNATQSFTGIENLRGGSTIDTFEFQAGLSGTAEGQAGDDVFIISGGSAATIDGGNGSDILTGDDTANDWLLTESDGGFLNTTAFTGIENLTGGGMTDSFELAGGTVSGTIDGGFGTDELVADNVFNDWMITGANAGTVTGVSAFTSIENLTGGAHVDSFTLSGGTISGTIEGGAGMDELITADDSLHHWWINDADRGFLDPTSFTGIENLTGGAGTDHFYFGSDGSVSGTIDGGAGDFDLIRGDDILNQWVVSSLNAGTLNGDAFINIESLFGGSMTDVFELQADLGWAVSGEAGDDVIHLAGGRAVGFGYSGGDGIDTLIGDDIANGWSVNDDNRGYLNSVLFMEIENLTGGSMTDTFTLAGGTVSGTIDGDGGADELVADNVFNDWLLTESDGGFLNTTAFTGIESLTGGGMTDSFELAGGTVSGTIDGGFGADELVADNVFNDWMITGMDAGSVTGVGDFTGIENLTGGTMTDTFTLSGGTVSGTIDGDTGADELVADNVFNDWMITGANAGTVTGVSAFTSIENLTGGAHVDSFTLSGGTISGTIEGGAGMDELITADDSLHHWWINDADRGFLDPTSFTGIENLTGGAGTDHFYFGSDGSVSGTIDGGAGDFDLIRGDDILNQWVVSSLNAGTLNGDAFINIESLFGGSMTDVFELQADLGWAVSGEAGDDVIHLAGGRAVGFGYSGGDGIDTLIGDDIANGWSVNDDNRGYLNSVLFMEIENLTGGSMTDTFTLAGGTVSGTIDGDGGADELVADNVFNDWLLTESDGGFLNTTAFTGIENLTGGGMTDSFELAGGTVSGTIDGGFGADELVADNVFNDWMITGMDAGTVTGVFHFTGIENLTGGTMTDTFTLSGGTVSGTIDGDTGADELVADNVFNDWMITGTDAGNVTGVFDFTGIENLTGGTMTDTFTLAGGTVSGTIDGDTGADELVADNVFNDWMITGTDAGNVTGVFDFTGIENLTGGTMTDTFTLAGGTVSGTIDGDTGADELVADNVFNDWMITGMDAGTVTGVFDFTGIENLTGGSMTDNFVFNVNGILSGALDGMGGADTADWSTAATPLTVTLGVDVLNVEMLTGGDSGATSDFTLAGGSDWDITGANDGTVDTIMFFDFGNLTGTAIDDTFTLSGGTVSGTIDGDGGADELVADNVINTWMITGLDAGTVTGVGDFTGVENLTGNADTDTFTLSGGSVSGTIDGETGTDELEADNSDNVWWITGTNFGYVQDVIAFTGIENLTGGSGVDIFHLDGGTVTGTIDGSMGQVDWLTANNTANEWFVNSVNAGTLNGVAFRGIENLNGDQGTDTFYLQANISGWIFGSGGDDAFFFNGGYSQVHGGVGSDTLTADNTNNWWLVNQADGGVLNNLGVFLGVEHLIGGSMTDTFDLHVGVIDTVSGGSGDDVFNMVGGSIGSIDGGIGVDTLSYVTHGSDVMVTLTDSGVLGFDGIGSGIESIFTGIDVLNGSSGSNDILSCDCRYLHRYLQLSGGGSVLEFSGFESILNLAVMIGFDLPPIVGNRTGDDNSYAIGEYALIGADARVEGVGAGH